MLLGSVRSHLLSEAQVVKILSKSFRVVLFVSTRVNHQTREVLRQDDGRLAVSWVVVELGWAVG